MDTKKTARQKSNAGGRWGMPIAEGLIASLPLVISVTITVFALIYRKCRGI